ncbi:hypothetical protein [Alicyclobacillus fastidiosus]|uniref:Uncharacterized protein n=1 Tax=Alicyclobacillus fastidiosus TaxID=392011 RepID=A0ABV5AKK7_9BACL|nr:hypothetical protein [Alicyclobacillus fastidiosus]WEH08201.1 hypothetical protein PYS47_15960 [Alicyclobacillus fastidiosus]
MTKSSRVGIELMRSESPYGERVFADGSAELFNRRYETIARRGERTSDEVVSEKWFYTDANPPWRNPDAKRRCEEILRTWSRA